MKKIKSVDKQYLSLMKEIMEKGVGKDTRAGHVRSIFGKQLKIDMRKGFPLLTTKKVYFKGVAAELLWFLHGEDNIYSLLKDGVHIWDGDAYRWYKHVLDLVDNTAEPVSKEEFLQKVLSKEEFPSKYADALEDILGNFYYYGDLGKIYGVQWNDFMGKENQIARLCETLRTNPDDRRMIVTAWNPTEIDINSVALPPCHVMFQVYTREMTLMERIEYVRTHWDDTVSGPLPENIIKKEGVTRDFLDQFSPERAISLMWIQRSVDVPCGLPFNIASYGLLLELLGKMLGMMPEYLVGSLGDCHIYENQIDGVMEQLQRDPKKYELPALFIHGGVKKNLYDYTMDDIQLADYKSYPAIKFPLNVG